MSIRPNRNYRGGGRVLSTRDFGRREGIEIAYRKRKRTLLIRAWYDTIVGIEPIEMNLAGLLKELGVPRIHIDHIAKYW